VVARGMGKPCVSGCEAIHIDDVKKCAVIGDTTLHEGDVVTINGSNGHVYAGEVPTVLAEFSEDMRTLLSWSDQVSHLKVMANADTPEDAVRAREFGAMGIGLCRTERMFNATDRLPIVQEMILAESSEERQSAIDRLLPIQRSDFKGIFKAMKGLPVTVRLMDPPLHEFLPTAAQLELEIAHLHHLRDSLKALEELPETLKLLNPKLYQQYADGLTRLSNSMEDFKDNHLEEDIISKKEKTLKKVRALSEVNPMLGHRGVRLGVTYPELYSMQIQAILEAAALCAKEGIEVYPEIMVPQVATVEELARIHSYVKRIHKLVELTHGINVGFKFGSMLEVVRACLRAGRMAEMAEFFSFGTNDLTQATFSFSREDAENKFLPNYVEAGILDDNPFEVLDQKGVGELMKLAVTEGRKTNPDLKIGICGEHGGHPGSIAFCHKIGLSYVSCSGPRVPIARLAAAQAQLLDKGGKVPKNA
jgi:pyruvate,orthophosphate dikinase